MLLRADSAYYGHATIGAAVRVGAQVSVTVRMDANVEAAIAAIDESVWQNNRLHRRRLRRADRAVNLAGDVAEIGFTGSPRARKPTRYPGGWWCAVSPTSTRRPHGRAADVVRHWRSHAFFTTSDPDTVDTVTADATHRQHAVIEQVHADLKNSALAHLPFGSFADKSAWLVLAVMDGVGARLSAS